jgi:hypothetical protein
MKLALETTLSMVFGGKRTELGGGAGYRSEDSLLSI